MGRLRTTLPRVSPAPSRVQPAATRSEQRMTGRRLQARRLRIWSRDPRCRDCRTLTEYPHGFELDHEVPLAAGGEDSDENCAVRCPSCHERKTRRDMGLIGGGYRKFPGS